MLFCHTRPARSDSFSLCHAKQASMPPGRCTTLLFGGSNAAERSGSSAALPFRTQRFGLEHTLYRQTP